MKVENVPPEEITQKLTDLKRYSREYDQHKLAMRYARNEHDVRIYWYAMLNAETHYMETDCWLDRHGIRFAYNHDRECYEVISPGLNS